METFIESSDLAFGNQLDNFCSKLDNYSTSLGLNAADINALKQTNNLVQFILEQNDVASQFARTFTAYKNLVRYGMNNQVLGEIPAIPQYPDVLPPVTAANAQKQFADMIQACVRNKNFNINIGQDLGIIKAQTVFDPETGTPAISIKTAQGGHPLLHCKIGRYEAFEVWKDSGDNLGFKMAGTSLHPDYLDLSDLPSNGATTTWKYKAIYLYQGQRAGNWSNEVTITAHGNV